MSTSRWSLCLILVVSNVSAAQFGDIPVSLVMPASQSVRRNAGNTAFEAFTPSELTIGGSNTQVQYNDGGVLGGDANFIWNKTTSNLMVTGNQNEGTYASVINNSTGSGYVEAAVSVANNIHVGIFSITGPNYPVFGAYLANNVYLEASTPSGLSIIADGDTASPIMFTSGIAGESARLTNGTLNVATMYQIGGTDIFPLSTTRGGVPSGGTTGQALTKNSNTNYDVHWSTVSGGGGTPGGSNTQVQFNNSGAFGGDAGFTWDNTGKALTLSNSSALKLVLNQSGGSNANWFQYTHGPTVLWYVGNDSTQTGAHDFIFVDAYDNNTKLYLSGTSNYLAVNVTEPIGWASTGGAVGSPLILDTALYRNSAGVVEINNGTAGQFRDLKARGVYSNPSGTDGYGTFISGGGIITGGSNAFFGIYSPNTTPVFALNNDGRLNIGSGGRLTWDSTTNPFSFIQDTGLARNAAGVIEINNGTAGQYRDLILRNLTVNGTCTGCGGASFGTPSANSVNISAPTAGAASTAIRSDATLQLDQSIVPTWTGVHTWKITDAATSTVSTVLFLSHNSSATPVTPYGTGLSFEGKDSTTNDILMAEVNAFWQDPTHNNSSSGIIFRTGQASAGALNPRMRLTGGLSVGTASTNVATGIINADNGYKVNNLATAGKILIGDGTQLGLSTPTWPTTAGTVGYQVRSDGTNFASYPTQILNSSVTDLTVSTADIYLAGSNCVVAAGDMKAKGQYHCVFDMAKTAGTGTPVISVRIGTGGSTSDTAQITFTFGAGTSVADTGNFEVFVNWRTVGSGTSAVVSGFCRASHNLATTGLFNNAAAWTIVGTTSGGFDSSAVTNIGVSFNGGTAFAGTNKVVQATLEQ